jgi:hypothetical protein
MWNTIPNVRFFSLLLWENRFGKKKTRPDQREHRIALIVAIEGICHLLNLKPYKPFVFSPYVILVILHTTRLS